MRIKTGFSLSEEVMDRLEKERGLIPRSTFVEHILRKEFGMLPETETGE